MWLDFDRARGHTIIPTASVLPENDASVLFTNSGMHPLVPYLLGEKHPGGTRLANIQKCIRTGDIEEVGDDSHLTFFEMMGNWSLGDYFKAEKVPWSFEFLTSKDYLAMPVDKIHVTCFEGDEVAPRDTESAKHWEKVGIPKERIHFLNKDENWWQLPNGTGPCGPCSEMFMDFTGRDCEKGCNPSCSCGRFVEIGNDVYMEFVIQNDGEIPKPAKQKNVDTGMGLERLLCILNGATNVYETELFMPAIKEVEKNCGKKYNDHLRAFRVLVEHTRAATIIIGDGVIPSNSGTGYVLRRLIRRAVRMANQLGCTPDIYPKLVHLFLDSLAEGCGDAKMITPVFVAEVEKFTKTLEQGLREFEKVLKYVGGKVLSGKTAFKLYETYGFPIELTTELGQERSLTINMDEYLEAKRKHAETSQTAAAGSFKGGMADTTGATTELHTASHLLLKALRMFHGEEVVQKGSNITPERLRFDFNLDRKLAPDELAKIEGEVNKAIKANYKISSQEMTLAEAQAAGALGTFCDRYGDKVKVYAIGDYHLEICGGPHVATTGELGTFKIQKEESVAAGRRRIKATLTK